MHFSVDGLLGYFYFFPLKTSIIMIILLCTSLLACKIIWGEWEELKQLAFVSGERKKASDMSKFFVNVLTTEPAGK